MYLAITDLASSILWLLSVIVDKLDVLNDDYSLVCSILGPLQVYFYLASFVWTAIIGPPPQISLGDMRFLCLLSLVLIFLSLCLCNRSDRDFATV